MRQENIREGEGFEVTITDTDMSALDVTITITDGLGTFVQETATYSTVDDLRVATISFVPPLDVGTYEYMYTVTYTDGLPKKFPDVDNCTDDCSLPEFIVCEANDVVSS